MSAKVTSNTTIKESGGSAKETSPPAKAPGALKSRFKKAAETITLARQIVEGLKEVSEKNKSLQEVHNPPEGLKRVLDRMKKEGIKKLRAPGDHDEQKRYAIE